MNELQSKDYLSNNTAKGMQRPPLALANTPQEGLLYTQILSSTLPPYVAIFNMQSNKNRRLGFFAY